MSLFMDNCNVSWQNIISALISMVTISVMSYILVLYYLCYWT